MKIRNLLLIPATLVATLSSLTSCGVDRWPEYAAETELDQWITTVMRENYLWYADIPEDKNLNFFKAPEDFLKSIVSKEDNAASYIDTIYQQPLPSYGFDYNLYQVVNNDTAYNALITYVLPDSPASAAGLKRGDWIVEVNDEVITKKSEPKLLNTGLALKLTTGTYTYQTDPETEAQ
ncbi:PDZ domain-containing protein, partial [Bacteroides sp.]